MDEKNSVNIGSMDIGEAQTTPEILQGVDHYEERIATERGVYDREYAEYGEDEPLYQRAPEAWSWVEASASERIRVATGGLNELDYMIHAANSRPNVKILSLGSGPCGVELAIAQHLSGDYELLCTDLNPELLELGMQQARRQGLNLRARPIDLNKLALAPGSFDIVFAHAALHHLIAFEHIFAQVNSALTPDGEFVLVDVCGRNGFIMRDNSAILVDALFQVLPDRFKNNHTSFDRVTFTPHYTAAPTALDDFECVRSNDLLPLLAESFQPIYYVPLYSLMRRFFDTMYGPNYDMTQEQDRAIFNLIRTLDEQALDTELLLPETFFAVLRRGDTTPASDSQRLRERMVRDAGPRTEVSR